MITKVDADACIGCGLCANMYPDIYEMEGDKAVAKPEAVPTGSEEDAKKMAEDCPVSAIVSE